MEESIALLIRMVSVKFDKIANQLLLPYDLTHTQFKVLKYLYPLPPLSVRQVDMEEYFSLTNPTVTGMLRTMEKKGLVERVANPGDERSKVIKLTGKAYALQESVCAVGEQLEELLTSPLTGREQAQMMKMLQKIMNKQYSTDEIKRKGDKI